MRRSFLFILAAVTLILGRPACAQLETDGVARLESLKLADLKVENATFVEALELVRAAWARTYPDSTFPVTILEQPPDKMRETAHYKNLSALDIIKHLARAHFMSIRTEGDMLILKESIGFDEGESETAVLKLSDRAQRVLGITAESGGAALEKKLAAYGVQMPAGTLCAWFPDSKALVIRNHPDEVTRIKGLLMLLDAGFVPRKEGE